MESRLHHRRLADIFMMKLGKTSNMVAMEVHPVLAIAGKGQWEEQTYGEPSNSSYEYSAGESYVTGVAGEQYQNGGQDDGAGSSSNQNR